MIVKALGVVAALVAVVVLVGYFAVCPCSRIPGGPLSGQGHAGTVADWSFVNEVPLCQVQVDRGIPWSINLNCMATDTGELYVSCSRCEGKAWSSAALANPNGYIRVADTIYPVALRRVTENAELDRAWAARARKVQREQERPDHWWSFALTTR